MEQDQLRGMDLRIRDPVSLLSEYTVEYTLLFDNQVTNRNLFRYKSFLDRVIEARQVNVETFNDNNPLQLHPNTD